MKDLPKTYNPQKVEDKIYELWEESGFFNPDNLPHPQNPPFSITIPPPNITGVLHMGHALNTVIQDILIRKKRMQGFKTLWVPGIDHAGIATQVKVEKKLEKQGKTRFDLGKRKFLKEIQKWKKKYKKLIFNQLKKLGASCDWSRSRFTMDQKYKKAVKKAFNHYWKKGWIYEGKRVINWCARCQTSLSDLELTYQEKKGKLWYIRYPLKDNGYLTVATTRPETMLGDTALALNPKDKRYKELKGQKAVVPLVNREVPIISDRLVDPKFGTGVVKITPSHDFKDYQIGRKHNLESVQVINKKREITSNAPKPYQGLSCKEARKKIIQDIEEKDLLEKVEPYTFQAPYCDRCKSPIEFIPSQQWFLKMDAKPAPSLKKMAQQAVKKGKVKFYPPRWEKVYLDWLQKVRDWCISRQIWWGHKIPLKETEDVLDTWFSSALWPFAVLGWPKKTKDLKTFYPTQVLYTDPEIINLWVTRMIFSGLEFMGEVPFKNVYIHSTVLTRKGKRMSKSKGTGVDPMKLIPKYGADATRFGIAYQVSTRQDLRFVEDNIAMGEKFCNKLWNASRFILLQFKQSKISPKQTGAKIPSSKADLSAADKRIIKKLKQTIEITDKYLEEFEFGKAAHQLYDFFWHDFCDQYIEEAKDQIKDRNLPQDKKRTLQILTGVLINSLKLLHPFVPFITEELYQKFPLKQKEPCLMVEKWPLQKENNSPSK